MRPTIDRRSIGSQAEQLAWNYLEQQGLILITHNFRYYTGEIDLIMKDKEHVVFVEVRSRSRKDYGRAEATITPAKKKKLIKTATYFLQKKRWLYKVYSRFDVIAIHYENGKTQLEWFKNAF